PISLRQRLQHRVLARRHPHRHNLGSVLAHHSQSNTPELRGWKAQSTKSIEKSPFRHAPTFFAAREGLPHALPCNASNFGGGGGKMVGAKRAENEVSGAERIALVWGTERRGTADQRIPHCQLGRGAGQAT